MFWHQRREAVAARDTTEKVRQNAEALLTNITHDFRATVEAKVGSLNALKEIAASAGQYYENLPASLRDERSLRLELVNGLLRADIARNANELEASLAEATAVKQSLAATSVQRGGDWWLLKSRAEIATAEVLEKQDRQAEAISEGHAAIESARRALQEANQPEAKRWLAVALLTAAQAQTSTKSPAMADLAAAEKFLEEARALIAAVNTSRPPLLDHARQQGWILYESGQVAKKHASPSLKDPTAADHLVQAKRFYAEASAVLEKALEADSANISVRRDLLAVQDALGDCEGLSQPPDYAAALQFHTQALDTARWLSLRDPDNASWQRELASAQTNLADDLVHLHRFAEATALLGQALGIHRVLVSRQPGDMDSRRSLVDACIRCGKLWLAAGKLEEALADFTSAQQAVEAARTQDPASTSAWTGRTIAILLRLGEVELKRKPSDHAKVRTLYEKALALGTELEKAGKLSSVDEKNLKEVRLLLKTLSAP